MHNDLACDKAHETSLSGHLNSVKTVRITKLITPSDGRSNSPVFLMRGKEKKRQLALSEDPFSHQPDLRLSPAGDHPEQIKATIIRIGQLR
jgi:hypothetical protein